MITIRPIKKNDAKALRDLYVTVIDEQLPYILENSAPTIEQEEDFIEKVLTSKGIIFVAEDENLAGKLVGMITLNRMTHPQLNHRANFGISVSSSVRSNGIGTQLIEQAICWCQQQSISQLTLDVLSSNPAMKLYQRLNFVNIGENHRGIKVNGAYQSLITMALDID